MEEKQEKKERKPNWQEVYATVDDIRDFLSNRIFLRHNVITRRVEYRLPTSWTQDFMPDWQPINDRIVNSLWTKMSRMKPTRIQDVYRVIESDFVPDYNPFTDYLDRLKPWDGSNNILVLSMSVTVKGGPDQQMLFYQYLRKWLVGVVAGWVDPNEVNHEILVLIGEQGSFKTTWFQYLLPPELRVYFYTKTNANRLGRDDLLTLAQYGLVCYEELDTMRPQELNQLKAAVTMQSIDERAAYARYHEHRKHIASFCGTGNNVQFLNDPTGNRRWLPFEIESISNPRYNPIDYEGVFAEAYALYQDKDFCHWFTSDEMEQLSLHNEAFEATQQELELIRQRFRVPGPGEKGEFVTRTDIMQAIGWNPALKLNINNISPAMKKLGFPRKRTNTERGYVVCRYTDIEINEQKWAKALIAKDENAPESDNSDACDTII